MRNIQNLNQGWLFTKPGCDTETVNIPHSWNAIDGQDGGNDYFRGTCRYQKTLTRADLPEGERLYLEIRGANSSADVTVNGTHKAQTPLPT